MMVIFIKLYKNIKADFKNGMVYAEPVMVPFAIFWVVAYPLFYLINLYMLAPQEYNSIALRVSLSIFSLVLALKNYWPKKMHPYLPIVWYSTLLIVMPFFATFMTLKNHFCAAWAVNSLAFLMWMTLLVDWLTYTVLLLAGMILGFVIYYFSVPEAFPISINPQPITFLDIAIAYTASIVLAIICSRNKKSTADAKLEGMKIVGASLAHELRTPLASISMGIGGVKKYLPDLIKGYTLAKQHGLAVPAIRPEHYTTLYNLLTSLEAETHYSQTIIDMQLLRIHNSGEYKFTICSVKSCIESAIQRYPFNSAEQRALVNYTVKPDFMFNGVELLVVHILFNLLKNALYYIDVAGKGKIFIWTECQEQCNNLYFKDTGAGMSKKVYNNIFKNFFTHTHNGTGVGLYFCKSTMERLGGKIDFHSQEHEYTEFILSFPKL